MFATPYKCERGCACVRVCVCGVYLGNGKSHNDTNANANANGSVNASALQITEIASQFDKYQMQRVGSHGRCMCFK